MEMNTRLQVEHPVTEAITGLDLVEWQLLVAAGGALPLSQEVLRIDGHAIEARLYAEDPARDFLPASGRLRHLRFPPENRHLRIDSGVAQGDEISPHYDPMIAKIIAWDQDREAALRRLRRALADCELVGVTTNLGLLSAIAGHPAFAAAALDTRFIAEHGPDLQAAQPAVDDRVLALACVAEMLRRRDEAEALAAASGDRHSPWYRTDGWRLNVETHRGLAFVEGERELSAVVHYRSEGVEIEIDGRRLAAEGRLAADGRMIARLGDLRLQATVVWAGDELTLLLAGASYRLRLLDPLTAGGEAAAVDGHLAAPMPGKVVQVKVAAGDQVEAGAALLILEAMKMEHTITAPADGRIAAVHYREGESVEEGVELLAFEPGES
jgi:3-methylcrotonyl-CoA carboxylase alpha subunit